MCVYVTYYTLLCNRTLYLIIYLLLNIIKKSLNIILNNNININNINNNNIKNNNSNNNNSKNNNSSNNNTIV